MHILANDFEQISDVIHPIYRMRNNLLVSFTNMQRMSQWLNISDFASGLYLIFDGKHFAVAVSVFGVSACSSDSLSHPAHFFECLSTGA